MMQNNIKAIRIGDYIQLYDKTNKTDRVLDVIGINKDKSFMPTVANLNNIDLRKYKVITKGIFIFSGMQTGRDVCIRIGYYENETDALISPAYTTFEITDTNSLLPEYLFMYFYRSEMDRYGWFISDSSVRANLDWPRFLDIEIPVPFKDGMPDIHKQQELVDTWKGLRNMKEENEAIASPLFSLCQSYIQELKHSCPHKTLYDYIEQCDERNSDNEYAASDVRGLATSKQIIETKANLIGVVLTSYKVLKPCEFAFVSDTSRRADKMSLGYNNSFTTYIVSSISTVFRIKNSNELIPEFLYLWFCRSEFDRYARFHSWGSARETFSFEEMCRVKMPIPSKDIQQAVVDMYNCANEAKKIAEEADILSKNICPALIQHVIHNN